MYFGQTRPLTEYDRQIRYLDYMENGLRTKGAGFVKLEKQDELCSISLQVSGLYRKDRLVRPLFLLDEQGERELCRLELADGGIKLYMDRMDCRNLDGQGLAYEQLTGLRIPISENKEICCRWENRKAAQPVVAAQLIYEPTNGRIQESAKEFAREFTMEQMVEPVTEFIPLQELVEKVETAVQKEPLRETQYVGQEDSSRQEQYAGQEVSLRQEPYARQEQYASQEEAHKEEQMVIKDDKWEQLWSIYPHTSPFSDDREYISMGPSDFVILAERHYKLANNSFLLHGYYNYHHLILTRIRERNQIRYYVGVPGIFLEREKRTAIMFGFKSFECAIEPAEDGDFGYYMIPVEL